MYKVTLCTDGITSNFEVDNKERIIDCWNKRGLLYSDIDNVFISYDMSKYSFIKIEKIKQ